MDKNRKIPGPAVRGKPLEVEVTYSFEDAFRRFKSLVQKERIVGQVKARMQYEKPSQKKRRKRKEAQENRYRQAMREKMMESGEWEKRKKKKEQRKAEKLEKKIKQQQDISV